MSVEVERVRRLKREWEQAARDLKATASQPYTSRVGADIKQAQKRVDNAHNAYESARNSLPADKRSQV